MSDDRCLDAQLRRITGAEAKSVSNFIRRFFDHLAAEGFTAATRYDVVRRTINFVIEVAPVTRLGVVVTFENKYRELLQNAKRPAGWQKLFLAFLTAQRLVKPSPWRDLAQEGRTDSLIANAPAAFRDGLEVFRRDLVAERRYRTANRERRRSLAAEHAAFLGLVRCAKWLADQKALGWQQMTAERLRAFTRDNGFGSSCFYAQNLALLRRFFGILVGAKRLFRNPLARVRAPLPVLPIERVTSEQQRSAWLELLQAANTPSATRCVGLLTVLHGVLPKEICDIRLPDLRTRSRTLWLRRSRASIPLDPITSTALKAYVAERRPTRNPHLFVSEQSWRAGSPVSNSFVGDRLLQAGIPGATVARQNLIRDVLDRENPVVAARVLRLSIHRIHVYLRLFGKDKALQPRISRAAGQDRLAI